MNKRLLLNTCKLIVKNKLNNIQQSINGYQEDLNSETKSSAGDKHETGRAMLQLEMEKLGQQYQHLVNQKNRLDKIELHKREKTQVGSLIIANKKHYFLAESIGQVNINGVLVMVISINAPIGKLLLGKQKKDSFIFNQQTITIDSIL